MAIARIEPRERVAMDREPIEDIVRSLGHEKAEALVGSAMEELALWMNRAGRLCRSDNRAELMRLAQLSAAVARRLGMTQLATIAAQVADLARDGDPNTLAAVTARMARVGEGSLLAVWESQGLTV
jgi:hypothetical protein